MNPSMRLWLIIIVLVLMGVTLYNLFTAPPPQELRVEIPYSLFKDEAKKENIQDVLIVDSRVEGTLKKSFSLQEKNQKAPFTKFSTQLPAFADPELMPALEKGKTVIQVRKNESAFWGNIIGWLIPIGLFVVFWWFISRSVQQRQDDVFGFGRGRIKTYTQDYPKVTFNDVAGAEQAKKELTEIIAFLKNPEQFAKLGAKVPKGVLIMGPPGTGKTLLAKAVAGEAGVPFFSMSGSEFVEMFVGVGASRVRDLFDTAKKAAPSIIFIDELDAVGRRRFTGLGGGHDEREQTLNQILVELDGFEPRQGVVLISATNRPDVLDVALLRPGRFDRHVVIDLPNLQEREAILKVHARSVPMAKEIDLTSIARGTPGFSGADLANIINEASLLAARNNKAEVDNSDLEEAKDKVIMGAPRSLVLSEEEKRSISIHESGHTLIAKLIPRSDPIHKVTIIPRGVALGVTQQLPVSEMHIYAKEYLTDKIVVMLGGRAAEKIMLNQQSSGAQNDLRQATELARRMVCQWGMSDKLGPMALEIGGEYVFLGNQLGQAKEYSDVTARIIDEEVQKIVAEGDRKAGELLKGNLKKLELLSAKLLEKETLTGDEVDGVLKTAA